jgi:predicted RNA polymerase sigma factor
VARVDRAQPGYRPPPPRATLAVKRRLLDVPTVTEDVVDDETAFPDAYERALALVRDDAERRLLERRLAELGS